MATVNAKGEIADFLDVNQFIPGRSAYECVAYSAALIKYCGQPGKGPSGTALQASNLAQFWYGKEEGSNAASNTNGMSLEAEYNMLQGMGLAWIPMHASLGDVKSALQEGMPVMLCGAETGMHDLELGDRVPYAWAPTGNHCIVASGIASDGNLLVHDCASIAPTGVRTGPRHYDASKLQIVSVTAVKPTWEIDMSIDIHTSGVANYYTETDVHHWACKPTGKAIAFGILDAYKAYGNTALCGLTFLGLPKSNEIAIEHINAKYAHLAGKGIVVQVFERGVLCYDPSHLVDSPPGTGSVYPIHIYDGIGSDLLAATQPTGTGVDPSKVKNFQQALELQAHDLAAKAQALESALIVPIQ